MLNIKIQTERRAFLKATGGIFAFSQLFPKWTAASIRQPKKYNLLFVFTDQQSYDMLGCYGNKEIITPNIDALAKDSVVFNHCISNTPVCSPMRAMLISGQHPLKNGVIFNDMRLMTDNGTSFPRALANAGYSTGYVGKWHLYGGKRSRPVPEGPHRHGFGRDFYTNNCHLNYDSNASFQFDPITGKKQKFNKWEATGQTDQTLRLIDKYARDKSKPFGLFLSYHPPHDHSGVADSGKKFPYPKGYMAPGRLMAEYQRKKITLRKNVKETEERPMSRIKEDYHGYYAMCMGIDKEFGRIIKKLKEKNLYDNTVIVYTADHGDLLSSHGRPWAKSFPEDESCRIPFILKYPASALKNSKTDLLFSVLDMMPTLLGLLGITVPKECDGKDLSKAILARDGDAVDSIPLFYFRPSWRGVYTKRYTYSFQIDPLKDNVVCDVLYDRKDDPFQQKNRFTDPGYDKIKKKLHALTIQYLDKFNDQKIGGIEIFKILGIPLKPSKHPDSKITLSERPVDTLKKRSQ